MTFSHNVQSVVSDIEDVKDDLRHEIRKRVGSSMAVVQADAARYIIADPHASGDLFRSLKSEQDTSGSELSFSVYTDPKIAPHAAVVEFGSGNRTGVSWKGSQRPRRPEKYPPDWPYDAPDIDNISGFAFYIEQWMMEKGIPPRKYDTLRASALAIATTIDEEGTYAHPFMRPAWFDNELYVHKSVRNAVRNATR